MSLLFNMLSRLVIACLPKSKLLWTSWLQSPSVVILESRKIKSITVPIVSPSICHGVIRLDTMILVFECWVLASFFTLLFHLHQKALWFLFAFCIKVMSSAFLRLLIFLPAILIPASAAVSLAFHMMYSAYKLNKQGDNIQPCCTPFPILNQSVVPCSILTVASWPAYRFLRRQVRCSGITISLRIFHGYVVIHTGQRL